MELNPRMSLHPLLMWLLTLVEARGRAIGGWSQTPNPDHPHPRRKNG